MLGTALGLRLTIESRVQPRRSSLPNHLLLVLKRRYFPPFDLYKVVIGLVVARKGSKCIAFCLREQPVLDRLFDLSQRGQSHDQASVRVREQLGCMNVLLDLCLRDRIEQSDSRSTCVEEDD